MSKPILDSYMIAPSFISCYNLRSTSGTFEFPFCLGDEIDWTLTNMDSQVIRMKQNQVFFSHDRNGVEEICWKNGKTYHLIGIRIPGKTLTQLLDPT